jgi:hypothetical protein
MGAVKTNKQKLDGVTANELQQLIIGAKQVLKHNDLGDYIVPSRGLYSHQVLWDACFTAIGLSHYDLNRAKLQIKRLLSAQWQNGMIPHIVFSEGSHYWWDRRIWRSWVSKGSAKGVASSGISQPPMLAEAIVAVGNKLTPSERTEWYRSVYPQLVNYHKWFYSDRDPLNDGLPLQIHPWEIALDNSPPCMIEVKDRAWPLWLRFLDITKLDQIGNIFRVDTKFVPQGQRSSNIEALALYHLLTIIRRKKYDSKKILKKPKFAISDVTYISILSRANKLLIEIARSIHEKLPESLIRDMQLTSLSFEKMWDEQESQYYDLEFPSGNLIKTPSIATFMPLYSGDITQTRAEHLVKLMEDETSFNVKYPLPTVPLNSDWFNPICYWQGPVWVNTNWLIIDGLRRYGFNNQADRLTRLTLNLVRKSGYYEYYDPQTGKPSGVNNFSWTAALTIDLSYKKLQS